MSQNSFPRREHVTALQEAIIRLGERQGTALEVAELGLDRYRCRYRFTLRLPAATCAEDISIHFQAAEQILRGEDSALLNRLVAETIGKLGEKC